MKAITLTTITDTYSNIKYTFYTKEFDTNLYKNLGSFREKYVRDVKGHMVCVQNWYGDNSFIVVN